MLCKVFKQNTKLHLPAHVKEGTRLPKGENKVFQLYFIMSQTHKHLLIPFSPREAVISLLYAYFQVFEWTSYLRNTAPALPTQFIARSSSLMGYRKMTLTRLLVFLWAFKCVKHGQF